MTKKREVVTALAPPAAGAYSQAVVAAGLVFVSGQIPIDPSTGTMISSPDIREHAGQALRNLEAILRAAGSGMDYVVKATIYLADIADFHPVNEVYAGFFAGGVRPARAAIQAGSLPLGARVEVDAIALVSL